MADKKNFTVGFDLADRFSSKYDELMKKISNLTDTTHSVDIAVDNSALKATDDVVKRVESSTAGMTKSVEKATSATSSQGSALQKANDSLSKTNDSLNRGTEAHNKHASAADALKGKYESLSGVFSKFQGVIAGVFAILGSGAIAGMSWAAADKSKMFAEQAYEVLGNRRQGINIDELKGFVDQAKDSGYVSSSDRLSLAYTMSMRGARTSEQVQGATEGIEKTFLSKRALLEKQYGITSMDQLAEMATKRMVGRFDKQTLDDIFGKGFSEKSQTARVRALRGVGEGIDVGKALEEDPLFEIQTRIKSVTKSIGTELAGVMKPLAGMFADFLGVIDRNPILPKILAIGAGFTAVAGVLITIISLLPLIKTGIASVSVGMSLLGKGGGLKGMATMLTNPYVALAALAAIILVVLYKTGYLQKAWDKFTKSAIGSDIISGIKSVGEWISSVGERLQEWYASGGKSQLLGYLETFCSILGTAYDIIDGIYSRMRDAGASPLLAALGAINSIPLAIAGGIFQAATGKDPGKILEDVKEILSGVILAVLHRIEGIYDKFRPYVIKIVDALTSVVEKIKGLWSFIKDGLGITAMEKEETYKKLSESTGYYMSERYTDSEGEVHEAAWMSKTGGTVDESEVPANVRKAYSDWQNAPDSVFSKIGEAISGAFTEVEKLFEPVLNPLTTAIDSLVKWLEGWFGGGDEDKTPEPTKGPGLTGPVDLGGGYTYTPSGAAEAIMAGSGFGFGAGHAEGVTFRKDGVYTGKFHGPEEVLSREATIKGPGIIARAMEALDVSARSTAANQRSAVKPEVHIHNDNRFDFAGAKIDSAFDIAWFMREVDKRIEAGSKKAVERAIGQGRT